MPSLLWHPPFTLHPSHDLQFSDPDEIHDVIED